MVGNRFSIFALTTLLGLLVLAGTAGPLSGQVSQGHALMDSGEVYLHSGKLAEALDYIMQAAGHYEESGEGPALGQAYMLMAETYNKQGNRENEKRYLQKTIAVFEELRDTFSLAFALHNLGYFNYSRGEHDSALVLYTETLELFEQVDHPYASYAYYVCLGNLGLVHCRMGELDKAEAYLLTAMDTVASLGYPGAETEFMIGYSKVLRQKGRTDEAIGYAYRAFSGTDDPEYERDASQLLAQLYAERGQTDSAYHYQSLHILANDSLRNIETVQEMARLRTEFEVGRKQAEVDALEKNKLISSLVILGLAIILLLTFGLVRSYYTNLKRSRRLSQALEERRVLLTRKSSELKDKNDKLKGLNREIREQNTQILEANEELRVLNEAVSRQKDDILDSITYARKIQSAMLPPEQYVHEILDEVFILFRPRDIVSGDFYWIKQVNHYVILAAADCTGHGVPGAFMSLLGISFLNEIVQRREITRAGEVLNELRKQIRNSLRQHGQAEESMDGIDMALCVIDQRDNVLQYAGANNPLYLIRNNEGSAELLEYKADRMPLGYFQGRTTPFRTTEIPLESGDILYLFSDGYVDQKGGRDNKKFLSKRFKELLLKIHQEPMKEQNRLLDSTISEWMGDNPQIDDILVMGLRI